MSHRWNALLGLHVAVFLFGVSALFGKTLALPAIIIVLGRTFFGSVSLLAVQRARKSSLKLSSKRAAITMVALGGLLAFHWFAFFHSIQISSVAIGLLTYSSFPVFTTLLEPWLLSRPLLRRELLLAGGVAVGLVLVVPNYEPGSDLFRGAMWGLVSGATFALLQILNKKCVEEDSGLNISLFQNFWAFVWLLPLSAVWTVEFSASDLWLLALLGVFCTGIAHALYIHSMTVVTAQFASVIAALEPVYGIAFAFLLLGETSPPRVLLGGAIIVAATVLASWKRQAQRID